MKDNLRSMLCVIRGTLIIGLTVIVELLNSYLVTMTTSTILVTIIKVDSFVEIRGKTTTTHT